MEEEKVRWTPLSRHKLKKFKLVFLETFLMQFKVVVKVIYGDSPDTKVYDALDFLALLSCRITDRWERRVIAYGY